MQAPDPIETVLARLMPPALRQDCQMHIEEMIDELAGHEPANVVDISSGRWLARCLTGGGIAAAIGALIAIFPMTGGKDNKVIAEATAPDRDLVLVKEAQLAEALRRSRPGEEIVISGIKDGKPLEMRMKLGEEPVPQSPLPGPIAAPPVLPNPPQGPLGVINVAGKSASLTGDDGIAVVWREGQLYGVKISDVKNEATFERQFSPNGTFDTLPEIWRHKIQGLRESLDQALVRGTAPQREPRPRKDPQTPTEP